jgi:hypothetical protein
MSKSTWLKAILLICEKVSIIWLIVFDASLHLPEHEFVKLDVRPASFAFRRENYNRVPDGLSSGLRVL